MTLRLMIGLGMLLGWGQAAVQAQDPKPQDKKAQDPHYGKAQEPKKADAQPHDQGMDPQSEAWMQATKPGEEHKRLEPLVGEWTYVSRWRMTPEMPWTESNGASHTRWVMDGRYIIDDTEGVMMGEMPFKGMGITGYDKMKNKYLNTWIDNMGTSITLSEGTCDATGKEFTYTGKMDDCMSGQKDVPYKMVIKVPSNSEHTMEWWSPAPDGKMFMSMELKFARK